MNKKVYVTLENGKVFEGYSFGAEREAMGELVFTTGMVGYMQTLTDPSYYGQVVAHTFPLIGNYGKICDEEGAKCHLSAYIVREKCDKPSNFRSQGTLESFLKAQNVPAVYGIDTRELTKIVREAGVMNVAITFKPLQDFTALKNYRVENAVAATSTTWEIVNKEGERKVALYDFGATENLKKELETRGCTVIKVPALATAQEVLALNVDGIALSGGAGNPEDNLEIIQTIKELAGKKPILGIGLGHQLFALAMGGKTRKMKYGHRGGNQPVKRLATGGIFVSAQNHGYEVVSESLKGIGEVTFVNMGDGGCEGMEYPDYNALTLQFHPEDGGGPHGATYVFDDFIALMKKEK